MDKNKVVTISGSMKYSSQMIEISKKLELENKYVVIQCIYGIEEEECNEENINLLSLLHKKKIDISDAIYVVNIDGYIGNSTKEEIEYAKRKGKEVLYYKSIE